MLLLITFIAALFIFLFSMDLSWSNVVSGTRNNLVFEGRNMSYGAYRIRHEHHSNLFIALAVSTGVIAGGLAYLRYSHGPWESTGTIPMPHEIIIPIFPPDQPARVLPKTSNSGEQASQGNHEQSEFWEVVDNGESGAALAESTPGGNDGAQPGTGEEDIPGELTEPFSLPVVTTEVVPSRICKNAPRYSEGVEAMMLYMQSRVRFNEEEIRRNVQGIIHITFTVLADGRIVNVYIENGIRDGERLERQAVNAIREMPRWIPGDNGVDPIPVIVTMPLKMSLKN